MKRYPVQEAIARANEVFEKLPGLVWTYRMGPFVELHESGRVVVASPAMFSAFGNYAHRSLLQGERREPIHVTYLTRALVDAARESAKESLAHPDGPRDKKRARVALRIADALEAVLVEGGA